MPNSETVFSTPAPSKEMFTPRASSKSAAPDLEDDARFPCLTTRAPAAAAMMAKICEINAEEIYITDDNPRNENPKLIRQMIISGFKNKRKLKISFNKFYVQIKKK